VSQIDPIFFLSVHTSGKVKLYDIRYVNGTLIRNGNITKDLIS